MNTLTAPLKEYANISTKPRMAWNMVENEMVKRVRAGSSRSEAARNLMRDYTLLGKLGEPVKSVASLITYFSGHRGVKYGIQRTLSKRRKSRIPAIRTETTEPPKKTAMTPKNKDTLAVIHMVMGLPLRDETKALVIRELLA